MKNLKLIFATGNAGKLREAREILGPAGIEVVSPYDLGLTKEQVDVEEIGSTFEENAVIKVQNLWKLTGLPCFADDSGLVVDALGGAPGIYSARYASLDGSGEDHNFTSNIDRLLHEMQGVSDRRARFVCVVALMMPEQGNSLLRYDTQPFGRNAPGSVNPVICLEIRFESKFLQPGVLGEIVA